MPPLGPLKVIIDNVVSQHKMSPWLADMLRPWMDGHHQMHIAALAPFVYVIIALLGALATYVDNYYTESVGQYVAHDLRMRMFHHLQRLSLGYYTSHQTGTLLSTITTDIQTIQGFASSSTLNVLVDLLAIVSMLGPGRSRSSDRKTALHTDTKTQLKRIADIKATVWQIKGQPGFTNLTLELWEWSTGEVLELSTKVRVDAASSTYAQLAHLASTNGLSLSSNQTSKTALVLENVAHTPTH